MTAPDTADPRRTLAGTWPRWLPMPASNCRSAQLWLRPGDGHISVLSSAPAALEWLAEHAEVS